MGWIYNLWNLGLEQTVASDEQISHPYLWKWEIFASKYPLQQRIVAENWLVDEDKSNTKGKLTITSHTEARSLYPAMVSRQEKEVLK